MASVELLIFAIRAGLKLGQQVREVYIESTRSRALTLPLPALNLQPDFNSALRYFFGDGAVHLAPGSDLHKLFDTAAAQGDSADASIKSSLLNYAMEFMSLDLAQLGGQGVTLSDGTQLEGRDWTSLLTVRQWERGEVIQRQRTLLTQVAGTIVEVGIDYFAEVPGSLNTRSKRGKVFGAVVEALDEIPFSQIDLASEAGLRELARRLLTGALSVLAEGPEFISSDLRVRELVKVTAKGLTDDVGKRLAQLAGGADRAQMDLIDWAELTFTSVLSSAGQLVLSQPQRFLGMGDQASAALVSKAGSAILGLAIDTDNDKLRLQNVIGRQGLEMVAKAALTAIAEHPDIFGKGTNEGVRNILVALTTSLSQSKHLSLDLLPQLAQVVLEATSQNLELVWPDGATDPKKHLLLTASERVLAILATEPPAGSSWKVQFGHAQILQVVEVVVDELVENPGWLHAGAKRVDANLDAALEATLAVIRVRGDERLSPTLVAEILEASVKAVVLRQSFIEKTLSPQNQPLVAAILDQVLSAVLSTKATSPAGWQLLRDEAILELTSIAFDAFSRATLTQKSLKALDAFLTEQVDRMNAGGAMQWIALATELDTALASAAA